MNCLTIAETAIRRDAAGRYCLNDLHRASGAEGRHRPSLWMANGQTQALLAEVESQAGIPASATIKGGTETGTYVAKELVYAYAMWISPAFHLKVIRAYDALVAQTQPALVLNLRDPKQLAAAALQLIEVNQELQQQIDQAQGKIAEMAPTVEAHDRIAQASAGSMCVTDAAKHLEIKRNDLFKWLSIHGWIYRRPGKAAWLGYQTRVQQGVLEHKVFAVKRPDGSDKVVERLLVTPKGLTVLAKALEAPVASSARVVARKA